MIVDVNVTVRMNMYMQLVVHMPERMSDWVLGWV